MTWSSPIWTSSREKTMDRALTLGGVPVLNRRRVSPAFSRLRVRESAPNIPSGPLRRTTSPTMVVLPR